MNYNNTMKSRAAIEEMQLSGLELAHHRAVAAIMAANPKATQEQAVDVADTISALVLETLKHFIEVGDKTSCN